MKSTVSVPNITAGGQGEQSEFRAQFGAYLAKQPGIVRGLHVVLEVFSLACLLLAVVCFVIALYNSIVWAFTGSFSSLGEAPGLPIAWVNFGLSMSLLVFPWGLDSMLMRVFPAIVFPARFYRSNRPISYKTGLGAFFAGFGIMCAGMPGAVYFYGLLQQALQNLF